MNIHVSTVTKVSYSNNQIVKILNYELIKNVEAIYSDGKNLYIQAFDHYTFPLSKSPQLECVE